MPRSSETISIRLNQNLIRLLEGRAKPYGDSKGEHAKRLLIGMLTQNDQTELNDQILRIREALDRVEDQQDLQSHELTGNLRRLSFVLLSTLAGMSSNDVEATVKRIFQSIEKGI